MNTCKTCVYWSKEETNYKPQQIGGWCSSEKLVECFGDSSYEPDVLVYSYHEGGSFWTGPDFGCVHHKTASLSAD